MTGRSVGSWSYLVPWPGPSIGPDRAPRYRLPAPGWRDRAAPRGEAETQGGAARSALSSVSARWPQQPSFPASIRYDRRLMPSRPKVRPHHPCFGGLEAEPRPRRERGGDDGKKRRSCGRASGGGGGAGIGGQAACRGATYRAWTPRDPCADRAKGRVARFRRASHPEVGRGGGARCGGLPAAVLPVRSRRVQQVEASASCERRGGTPAPPPRVDTQSCRPLRPAATRVRRRSRRTATASGPSTAASRCLHPTAPRRGRGRPGSGPRPSTGR